MPDLIDQGIREGMIVNKDATLIIKMIRGAIESAQDQRFYILNDISITEAIILYGLISKEK